MCCASCTNKRPPSHKPRATSHRTSDTYPTASSEQQAGKRREKRRGNKTNQKDQRALEYWSTSLGHTSIFGDFWFFRSSVSVSVCVCLCVSSSSAVAPCCSLLASRSLAYSLVGSLSHSCHARARRLVRSVAVSLAVRVGGTSISLRCFDHFAVFLVDAVARASACS